MKNINNNLILRASFSGSLSPLSSFIYVRISPSICLCQPLSFSCICFTIFHYSRVSLGLSALIEAAAAAAGRLRRYLIRRLNQWCGPMANPSANKSRETIISAHRSALALLFDFQFRAVLLAEKSKASHQSINVVYISELIHARSDPIANQSMTETRPTEPLEDKVFFLKPEIIINVLLRKVMIEF